VIFAFPECLEPAARLADAMKRAMAPLELHHFPDGETLLRAAPAPEVSILYRSLDRPNAKIFELLLAASALRDGGARQVVLVAPYLAYMRQDKAFHPGEAVSQKVLGELIAGHFDGLITIDPHLHRIASLADMVPGIPALALSAASVLAAAIATDGAPVLVGPDSESRQWVESIAAPAALDILVGEKRRLGDRSVEMAIPGIETVKGRPVVLVDDVVSSGVTLVEAARLALGAGASRVEAAVTHCLAGAEDIAAMREAGISRLIATDTVPGPQASAHVAGLIADALDRSGLVPGGGG